MCYYENFKYSCHDWKWGNFRQHCHNEYRTGETCGQKLIFTTINLPDRCPFCERIEKKIRRRDKAISDIRRWQQEPQKYTASMEKAYSDMKQLELEIAHLRHEKDKKYAQIGSTNERRGART